MVKMVKTVLLALLLVVLAIARPASAMDSDYVVQQGTDGKKSFSVAAEKKGAASTVPADSVGSSLRIAGLWLVLLGIGSAAFVCIRRRQKMGSVAKGAAARLSVVERLSLGTKGELLLVRACDRLLVVAAQGNQLTLLTDFAATEEPPDMLFADALAHRTTAAAPKSAREVRDIRDKREGRDTVREPLYRSEQRDLSSSSPAVAPAATQGTSLGVRPWPEPGEED